MEWQTHIRSKARREDLALRFREPKDAFQIVIVRDMWLTGFDAPSLHTMYLDKPMRGHGLMQAIARVNRVFKDKPGGLVVDYLGLADELKKALATYTESGGTGKTALDQAEAVAVMLEKYEICCGLFHAALGDRVGPGLHAGGAARGCAAHPRRRGFLSGGARGAGQGNVRRAKVGRGNGARHPADHFKGGGVRRGGRYLCRRRIKKTRHLDFVG